MSRIENCSDFFGDREPIFVLDEQSRKILIEKTRNYLEAHYSTNVNRLEAIANQAISTVECMSVDPTAEYDLLCAILDEAESIASEFLKKRITPLEMAGI